jgi:hypothetical protein
LFIGEKGLPKKYTADESDNFFYQKYEKELQRDPLNVITLGQRESENHNQMITISKIDQSGSI